MDEITFSPEHAVEAIIFFSKKLKAPDVHEVLKLQYFTDQFHLSEYGFIASGDHYKAMKYGPVAQGTYDLMKAARGDQSSWIDTSFYDLVKGAFNVDSDDNITLLREPNIDLLTVAEQKCMVESISRYGNLEFGVRTDLSHDRAWASAWAQAQSHGVKSWEIPLLDIARNLENAEEVISLMQS